MAQNKKEEFKKDELDLADFAKAIGHPARIAILKALAERETCICGEIVELMPLAQSTVSQHLKELIKADLIKGTIDGKKSCYCINWKTFDKFSHSFIKIFTQIKNKQHPTCC